MLIPLGCRQFDRQVFAKPEIHDAVGIVGVILFIPHAHFTAEFTGRPGPSDVDRTADGVPSKQRPLWAAKDLHALKVDTAQQAARVGADEHVIHDDRDRRIKVFLNVRYTDTTDKYRSDTTGSLRGIVNHDIGRDVSEISNVPRKLAFNLRLGQRAHGKTHVLQVLRALSRGDNDLLQDTLLRYGNGRDGQ